MSEKCSGKNYSRAKAEADIVDMLIIDTLKSGRSFRVEAGAGSGKTYSLNRVIEWVQANKWSEYRQKKQKVACITYTNAAVEVIAERLTKDTFILPSTIHSFAWNSIEQYQSTLVDIVATDPRFLLDKGDSSRIAKVAYTQGHRYKENGTYYLHHDDVIELFCMFLDKQKFRRIFADRYPLILIDEYQDSFKRIIDRFVDYFIGKGIGPQFGFFGDAWQTIYQSSSGSNKACGAIEHSNIIEIKKKTNFRSATKVVEFLNKIRPDLPQESAVDGFEGEVIVITCDDYLGERSEERYFMGELPADVLKMRLDKTKEIIKQNTSDNETLKVLMITHKVLATQQGYRQLLDLLGDKLRNKEDPFLLFFMNTVEPIYDALRTSNMQMLFDTLGKRYPITKKSEKAKWRKLQDCLEKARSGKAIDVLDQIDQSGLVPLPPKLEEYLRIYHNSPQMPYASDTTIQSFLELEYAEFQAAINFLHPEAEFSTDHGVKGEEYDNIVFVIGRGWNQYRFEKYAPMITRPSLLPKGREEAFVKNRNLFYVCCSRPKKRLFFFVSVRTETVFKSFLTELVGRENIYTYEQFVANWRSSDSLETN